VGHAKSIVLPRFRGSARIQISFPFIPRAALSANGVSDMVELRINGPARYEAAPHASAIRLVLHLTVHDAAPSTNPWVFDIIPRVEIMGIPQRQVIEESSPIRTGEDVKSTNGGEFKLLVRVTRQEIEEIENRRDADVTVAIQLKLRYFQAPGGHALEFNQGAQLEISESKWLKLLGLLGCESGWVVEVLRPNVVGWDKPVAHLQSARDRIDSHDPQGAVAECRAAWDSFEPLL
jgi:hypothetical protein